MCRGSLLDVKMWCSALRKSNSSVLLSCGAVNLWTKVVLVGERGTSVRAKADQKQECKNSDVLFIVSGSEGKSKFEARFCQRSVVKRSVKFGYYNLRINNITY